MGTGYNMRQAAAISGIPVTLLKNLTSIGVITAEKGFTFNDLHLLKKVRGLSEAGISSQSICKQLSELSKQVDLSKAQLSVHGNDVICSVDGKQFGASSGQQMLPLEVAPQGSAPIVSLAERRKKLLDEKTEEEWFEIGVSLEETEPIQAAQAYRNVLRLNPKSADSWINLGRIYAEQQETIPAMECFQRAFEINPDDSTAVYNLAVVAQDAGQDGEAVSLYNHALKLDPLLAEAHYNLATIYDKGGDPQLAIRHINEYRKIVKRR